MWTLKPHERLREWRTFREKLGSLSFEDALTETVHLWSYAPYVGHRLDRDRANSLVSWPDPWTLLHENIYCDIAKSLGMLYTLYLCKHRPANLELILYKDHTTKNDYNLVQIENGKYILNFTFDEVVNKTHLPKTLQRAYRYTTVDLDLEKY